MNHDDEKFLSALEANNKAFKFYHTDPAWLKHNIPYAETIGPTIDRLIAMVRERDAALREVFADVDWIASHEKDAPGLSDAMNEKARAVREKIKEVLND